MSCYQLTAHSAQVLPGDLVAQAAGHRSREEYNPHMAPDPEGLPAFAHMPKGVFSPLDRQIEQMEEVRLSCAMCIVCLMTGHCDRSHDESTTLSVILCFHLLCIQYTNSCMATLALSHHKVLC